MMIYEKYYNKASLWPVTCGCSDSPDPGMPLPAPLVTPLWMASFHDMIDVCSQTPHGGTTEERSI